MKIQVLKVALTVCTMAVVVSSCSDKQTKTKDENVAIIKDVSEDEKTRANEIEAYKKESREKIAANEKIISDLKARVNMSKQDARDNYNRRIEILEKRNNELKAKLESFQEKSEVKWNDFKAEFNHDMKELGNAFEDFTKKNVK